VLDLVVALDELDLVPGSDVPEGDAVLELDELGPGSEDGRDAVAVLAAERWRLQVPESPLQESAGVGEPGHAELGVVV
jgi:hypothetical protein